MSTPKTFEGLPLASCALTDLGNAIERALDECQASDVMSVLACSLIGLATALVHQKGEDHTKAIVLQAGDQRDVTISAVKPVKGGVL